jgi:hypothetical protein
MTRLLVRRTVAVYFPLAFGLTIAAVIAWAIAQSSTRTAGNNPQAQIASDAARRLDAGISPTVIAGGRTIDLARSLAAHISVYDRRGRLLASTARLDAAVPVPPKGVLAAAQRQRSNDVTWEPEPGVRVAAVVIRWRGGTVLVGRSLAPIAQREVDLAKVVAAVWLIALVVVGMAVSMAVRKWPSLSPYPTA